MEYLEKKSNKMKVPLQTKTRLIKMKNFLENGKTLEIGVSGNRITKGLSLDCEKKYNPDILCDLNKEDIPLQDNFVDVVVAGEILEHLLNPFKAVREFYRILRPKGILIISVPNICSLVNRINMLRGRLPSNCAIPLDKVYSERHFVDFNLKNIKEILKQIGFKTEGVTSKGLIAKGRLISKSIPVSLGETLIIKARK